VTVLEELGAKVYMLTMGRVVSVTCLFVPKKTIKKERQDTTVSGFELTVHVR
jgi:hypothetical protein